MTRLITFKLPDTPHALDTLDEVVEAFGTPEVIELGGNSIIPYELSTGYEPVIGSTTTWGKHTVVFAASPTSQLRA